MPIGNESGDGEADDLIIETVEDDSDRGKCNYEFAEGVEGAVVEQCGDFNGLRRRGQGFQLYQIKQAGPQPKARLLAQTLARTVDSQGQFQTCQMESYFAAGVGETGALVAVFVTAGFTATFLTVFFLVVVLAAGLEVVVGVVAVAAGLVSAKAAPASRIAVVIRVVMVFMVFVSPVYRRPFVLPSAS
jgi:hypothetical protein